MDRPPIYFARTNDGATIGFWTVGSGPPLVLVPYWPVESAELSWDEDRFRTWISSLAETNAVTFYDMRFAGVSSSPDHRFSLDTVVEDLGTVVQAVAPAGGCSLLAMHLWSPVGIAFAATNQEAVSKLVLFDPIASMRRHEATSAHVPSRELQNDSPEAYSVFTSAVIGGPAPPPGLIPHLRRTVLTNVRRMNERTGNSRWVHSHLGTFEVDHLLRRVTARVLVVHNESIRFIAPDSASLVAAGLHDAELRLIGGDSALPYANDLEAVAKVINEFLGGPGDPLETTAIGPGRQRPPGPEDGLAEPTTSTPRPDGLSAREVEVLELVAAGLTNQKIADRLVISLNTVIRHVSHILDKTGLSNRVQLASYASKRGISRDGSSPAADGPNGQR